MNWRRLLKRFVWIAAGIFLCLNVVAALHAWKFTHFSANGTRHRDPASLSSAAKLSIALTGIDNPRPRVARLPQRPYTSLTIRSNVKLAAWYLKTDSLALGTVLLFHGYGGEKSSMLDKAYLLLDAGYNVLLPDFMGAGGAEGNQTTIGFAEGRNVADCFNYLRDQYHERNIILLGTSMGAAAILKYLHDGNQQPAAIILECPFGTMYQTVCRRFDMVHAPKVPMAALLMFWGGAENGFWAFSHNPKTYAKAVHCPTLLLFGEKDDRVTRTEIDAIYQNLAGPKTLRTYALAGHNNYLEQYKDQWLRDVRQFLDGAIRR